MNSSAGKHNRLSRPDRYTFAAAALLACHALITVAIGITQINTMRASGTDTGVITQLMENLLRDGAFVTSLTEPFRELNWLGFHFSPILVLFAPVYALFPTPYTFQVIQSLCVAAAGIPLWFAVMRITGSRMQAVMAVFVYLINPYTFNAAISDFHENVLAAPLLAGLLYAIIAKRAKWVWWCAIFLLLTKEHYGLALIGSGMLQWRQGERRQGILLIVVGVAALSLVLFVLMPYFLQGNGTVVASRYAWLRAEHIIWGNVAEANIVYFLLLLLPFAFIPLLAPWWWLPGMADFATNMSAEYEMMRHFASYHSLPLIPVLVVAAFKGMDSAFLRALRVRRRELLAVLLFCSLVLAGNLVSLPLPGAANVHNIQTLTLRLPQEDREAIEDIKRIMPPGGEFGVQSNVAMWFAGYRRALTYPMQSADARYAVLHLRFPFTHKPGYFGKPYHLTPQEYLDATQRMLADDNWQPVYCRHRWVLMQQKGTPGAGCRTRANEWLDEVSREIAKARAVEEGGLDASLGGNRP